MSKDTANIIGEFFGIFYIDGVPTICVRTEDDDVVYGLDEATPELLQEMISELQSFKSRLEHPKTIH